ncbi:MAG: NADAR family protein [Planctomycetes bacterium]|nr:NADAR family protein [Planctomycetota bacterium]
MIDKFEGKYEFLSNFYPSVVTIDGVTYPTVEHAFQAYKVISLAVRRVIAKADGPAEAKRQSRQVCLRFDWEDIKDTVMLRALRMKFNNVVLGSKLLGTGEEKLIEGNTWGDTYWGVCDGKGTNMLGQLLMKVRTEIRIMQ